jgi:hypothetical protein
LTSNFLLSSFFLSLSFSLSPPPFVLRCSHGYDNFSINLLNVDKFPKYRSLEGIGAVIGMGVIQK